MNGSDHRCSLCGFTLPSRPVSGDDDRLYCCAGCRRVDEVLRNLDPSAHAAYITAARRAGLIPSRDGLPGMQDLDTPSHESTETAPSDASGALRTDRLTIAGFECPSCAWVAERLIRTIEGVEDVRADFMTGTIKVRYDMRRTAPSIFAETIAPFGYRIETASERPGRPLSHPLVLRFTVSAILTMNLMMLSMLRYSESLGWLDIAPAFLIWAEALLCSIVLGYGGMPILRRALFGVTRHRLTMDGLIALAALAAYALSLWALVRGRPDIYFETCAGLITISLLSRMIEARLRERACRDLTVMMRMPVRKVRVEQGEGIVRYITSADVRPGDRVVFDPGEVVPFDGVLLNDDVWISEAVLTGESRPVRRVRGEAVTAGSETVGAAVRIRVTRGIADTRLHEIAESLREAIADHELTLESADRIAAWFGPAVVLIAVIAWLVRAITAGTAGAFTSETLFPSIAVLATACPCAFSLAGVTALTSVTASLLRHGILIKNLSRFERAHRIARIVFDKTGTLTHGSMSVETLLWRTAPDPDLLALCNRIETGSRHPAATAIRAFLSAAGIPSHEAGSGITDDPSGAGRSMCLVDGRTFVIGGTRLFADGFIPPGTASRHTMVFFGLDGRAEGCFLLADSIRPEAGEVIRRVEAMGIAGMMLSGDREETVREVAEALGIREVHGGVTLDRKVEAIRAMQAGSGTTAYVGDGTNDALAMQAADFGIAVARATDEALTAADAVLLDGGLSKLNHLLAAARAMRRTIRMNYIWAFSFNVIFIPVAAMGYLTPLAAMGLMLISSILVLLNSAFAPAVH